MKYTYSDHARTTAAEREISAEQVELCVDMPDFVERRADGTAHYCKRFDALDGRWLRVVVNEQKMPSLIVTVFFDRRLRRTHDDTNR